MGLKQMEPVVEKLGDFTFYITPFPAFKAANLSGELASTLTPLLTALVPLLGGDDEDGKGGLFDVDVTKAASAISSCAAIDGNKIEKLAKALLLTGNVSVEYTDEDGNQHAERLDQDLVNEIFCGEVQDLFILCFYVIRLNFNGFFKRIAGLSGPVRSDTQRKKRRIV